MPFLDNLADTLSASGHVDMGEMRRPRLVALTIFALLAVVHTWPLAANPAHLSRVDNGDAVLNSWAIAWVAHQLPRDPVHLFDGNILYPERLTLAYSEAMIVQSMLAWPVLALGGSPVLALNVVLLAGFALTGWAFCLLVHRWTGSWAAAYCSGSLAAFNSHVLVRLPHIQTQHVEFMALMLFALDRLVTERRVRDAVLLGVGFALQALCSIYVMTFSIWMLVFGVAGRVRDWLTAWRRVLPLLAAAGVVAAALLAPYLFAYYSLHRLTGFKRTIEDGAFLAGSWRDYLGTGSRFHYAIWAAPFFPRAVSPAFPGIVATLLASTALLSPTARKDRRVQMCLTIAIGCAIVSMLPRTPIFPAIYRFVPMFQTVRVEAHLSQVVLIAIAVMAGYGVTVLGRRLERQRSWPAVAALLVVLVNGEALRAPLVYTPFSQISPVYDVLAGEPRAIVIELPFYPPRQWHLNAPYMLNSTRHWRPILNGYSGFRPASYQRAYDAQTAFPDPASLTALHHLGVTHIVVHKGEFERLATPERFAQIARYGSLQLIADDGDAFVYRMR